MLFKCRFVFFMFFENALMECSVRWAKCVDNSMNEKRKQQKIESQTQEMNDLPVALSSCTIDCRAPVARTVLSFHWTVHAISSISAYSDHSNLESRFSIRDAWCWHTTQPIWLPCHRDLKCQLQNYNFISNNSIQFISQWCKAYLHQFACAQMSYNCN